MFRFWTIRKKQPKLTHTYLFTPFTRYKFALIWFSVGHNFFNLFTLDTDRTIRYNPFHSLLLFRLSYFYRLKAVVLHQSNTDNIQMMSGYKTTRSHSPIHSVGCYFYTVSFLLLAIFCSTCVCWLISVEFFFPVCVHFRWQYFSFFFSKLHYTVLQYSSVPYFCSYPFSRLRFSRCTRFILLYFQTNTEPLDALKLQWMKMKNKRISRWNERKNLTETTRTESN